VKTSEAGLHLMHYFEGYRNKPYKCSAKIWTVGWGHAMYGDQLRLPNVRTETYVVSLLMKKQRVLTSAN